MKKMYCYCKACKEEFTIYVHNDDNEVPRGTRCPNCSSTHVVED